MLTIVLVVLIGIILWSFVAICLSHAIESFPEDETLEDITDRSW